MRCLFRSLVLVAVLAGAVAARADVRAVGLPQALDAVSLPLRQPQDLDPLVTAAGRARLVMMGDASHGTSEFHAWRDRFSRRLIEGPGFSFVAVEGDWSSLIPLDRYVRHHPLAPASAHEALLQIARWPRWLWPAPT